MADFSVEELRIPVSVGAAGWDDFAEVIALRNAVVFDATGTASTYSAEDLLHTWQNPNSPSRLFIARRDGRIIGRSTYQTDAKPDATIAWVSVQVLPGERNRGVGATLWKRILDLAVAERRGVLQGDSFARAGLDGPVIASPTGFGTLPLTDPAVRFALARDFQLGQVIRESSFILEGFDIAPRLAAARERSGTDFELVYWTGPTPEELLPDMAILHTKMSTDAPNGDLENEDSEWDEARVRQEDALAHSSPRRIFAVAARHIPSGRLVGYNDLWVPNNPSAVVDQRDTLVISDHRGHGLGMLLKLAGLEQLQRLSPGHPEVRTTNAEENRPMLDVNEALGFVPVSYAAVWKRTL